MAISDGLICQVYPVAGETSIKNIVNGTLFSGTGTPTLVDEGAEKAWAITTGTLLESAIPLITINGESTGTGATIALRFKSTALGSDSFMPIAGAKIVGSALANSLLFGRGGSQIYRGRVDVSLTATITSRADNTIHTLVYRVSTLSATSSDLGSAWVNTSGRVGTAANFVSPAGNIVTKTFDKAFINCQTSSAYTLLDLAIWSAEKTDAECAAIADNYRAVMPAPSGGTSPTGTVTIGTITKTATTASIPYTYSAADQTGFEYRLNGGTPVADAASPAEPTGLTPSTAYTAEVRAINASGNGAWSAVANFTTDAGGDTTPPTFTVAPAVTSITQTTATATATINETGNIYYVIVPQAQATPSVAQVKAGQNASGTAPTDSGSALATTTLSDGITGLTAGTAYKACFVAEDDEPTPNVQAAVTVVNFTTSAVAVGTITSQPLARNLDTLAGIVSLDYIDVRLQSTGALTVRKTGVSTNSSSIFTFSDAAITTGQTYIVSWKESGGQFGVAYGVVAS